MINDRITNGTPRQKPQKKSHKVDKENDWFFLLKKEKEMTKKLEDAFEKSLNPISGYIYRNCYLRCCKKKEKYSFKSKTS